MISKKKYCYVGMFLMRKLITYCISRDIMGGRGAWVDGSDHSVFGTPPPIQMHARRCLIVYCGLSVRCGQIHHFPLAFGQR